MLKLKHFLTLCTLLIVVSQAKAYDFQYNGLYYKITSSYNSATKTCEVTYGPSGPYTSDYTMTSVVVPEGVAYNGSRYIVTAIGENAFYNCLSLQSVQLNESVKTIGKYAFANDNNITSFSMPGVETLESQSLGWLKSLKRLDIPACTKDIHYDALADLKSLESITVDPSNPYYMSDNGILFNKDKTKIIHFPESRTGEYRVPDGVQEIEALCFFWSDLSKITVANTVKKIGARAFGSCRYLESIDLGNGVEDMSANMIFMYCPSLRQIVVPNSVKTIGEYFVNLCPNLEEVVFGENVEQFGTSSYPIIISLSGNYDEGIPNNTCLKNIVLLSTQIPKNSYKEKSSDRYETIFPTTPYGRREQSWKYAANSFEYMYSSSKPYYKNWYEASNDYTGLFCKGDTLFAFYNNTKASKPYDFDTNQYASNSDYKINPNVEFYYHNVVAFVFSKTANVDPKQFVGKKIASTELIGKPVSNIDDCGMPIYEIYTTPLLENARPGEAFNINTYRVINFAQPADDGKGYPYYLFKPTVGERCRVTGVYNSSKRGLYDSTTGFTLKLRNASGLTNGVTYTLEGIYRRVNGTSSSYSDGEAILDVLGDTSNSISKQPKANDLSVSLAKTDDYASYQWFSLVERDEYEETLVPTNPYSWYYSYGKWHSKLNTSNSYSDYSTSMSIPLVAEKGDILSFDWETYNGKTYGYDTYLSVTLGFNTTLLSATGDNRSGHVEKVLTEAVKGNIYVSTKISSSYKDAYAVISNIKIKHAGTFKVEVPLEGATSPLLTDDKFIDGETVWCEVTLGSGEKLESDKVETRRNSISKQPTLGDLSVELAMPSNLANYQWYKLYETQEDEPITGATSSAFDKISALSFGDIIYCEVTLPNGRKMFSDDVAFNIGVSSIELSTNEATLGIGQTLSLIATVLPDDAFNKNINWTSSNTSVATVSSTGVVTGKKTGTATITATAADGSGVKATATIKVYQPVTSITLSKSSVTLKRSNSVTLTASVLPSTASNKTVTWSTSDSKVASINNGIITAVGIGKATITATVADGLQAICDVDVVPLAESLVDGTNYSNNETKELDELTFSKTFSASSVGKWNAFYVPMSIDVEEYAGELDFAEIYAFCATVDTNGDGTVDANDEDFLFVLPVTEGSTLPNVPYLVRPKEAKTYVINSADNILYKSTEGKVEFATTRDKFTVTGINEPFTVSAGDNNYYVSETGRLNYRTTGSATVLPNRWIMHRESKNYGGGNSSTTNAKGYRIMAIGEDISENDAATAIRNAMAEGVQTGTFTIDGRKVDDTKSLPAGLYIKNGKKVFIR